MGNALTADGEGWAMVVAVWYNVCLLGLVDSHAVQSVANYCLGVGLLKGLRSMVNNDWLKFDCACLRFMV